MNLSCHVCGGSISGKFALVSMSSTGVDRPFVVHQRCVVRIQGLALALVVQVTGKLPV